MDINNSYSVDNFVNNINDELALKKRQLLDLTYMLNSFENNFYKATFMKVTVPELYAIYEGFFKFTFTQTINYLSNLSISNQSININYLMFPILTSLTDEIRKQKTKAKKAIDIFSKAFKENNCFLDISNFDDYILNLDSTRHTMDILEIDSRRIPMSGLNSLYQRRNEIAHGNISTDNPFYISFDSEITKHSVEETYVYWNKHYKCALYSLDTMANLFIDYIENQKYLAIAM